MIKKLIFSFIIIILFYSCSNINEQQRKNNTQFEKKIYNRVISLAPSLTEIVYILNADTQLVGVTQFCVYPQEAQQKPKIGGYTNINFEQVISLKPDLILALPVHQNNFKKFEQLKIPFKEYRQNTVDDIRNSILKISEFLGRENEASNFLKIFDKEMNIAIDGIDRSKKFKVLIIVGRNFGELKNAVCAGRHSFYNDLIERSGGINAAPESALEYNSLNAESIVSMNPDIIIEIYAPHSGMTAAKDENKLRKDWNIFKNVNAVKNQRIHYIIRDYATLPGPRIYLLFNNIKEIVLHN